MEIKRKPGRPRKDVQPSPGNAAIEGAHFGSGDDGQVSVIADGIEAIPDAEVQAMDWGSLELYLRVIEGQYKGKKTITRVFHPEAKTEQTWNGLYSDAPVEVGSIGYRLNTGESFNL